MAKIGQMDYCERDILIKLRERLRGKNNIFFAYFFVYKLLYPDGTEVATLRSGSVP